MHTFERGYHASFEVFSPGRLVEATERDAVGPRADVERILEAARPEHETSRMTGLFLARTPEHAQLYKKAEARMRSLAVPIYVYEVESAPSNSHPMLLVDRLARGLGTDVVPELVREYWSPRREWRFAERIVSRFTVTHLVTEFDPMASYMPQLDVDADKALINRLWPIP